MNDVPEAPKSVTRRDLMRKGVKLSGAAALLGMVPAPLRQAAWAGGSEGLETRRLTLGIIPLTDCAPLVVAKERGLFAKYGLVVDLSKQASWANVRDKVMVGALDGAHMLAGIPIASTLGIGTLKTPMIAALSLDLNGNAITVSTELYARMAEADPEAMAAAPTTARALKKVIEADQANGRPPMTFAVTYPVSMHNYELRYWLAAADIDPDRDVRLTVVPPPQMVAHLKAGNIVGYCVGEPWNELAVMSGVGRVVVTGYEIWNNSPEKVFGVTLAWAERNPHTHQALLCALLEAMQWMDLPEHREEVVRIISVPEYVDAPPDVVRMSMTGTFQYGAEQPPLPLPDFNVFFRYNAAFPWRSHAAWYLTQMLRWGEVDPSIDILRASEAVYRTDLFRSAATTLGLPLPDSDYKTEGTHGNAWVLHEASAPLGMGADRFVDGTVFDPQQLVSYLTALKPKLSPAEMSQLAKMNA